ncbi:hypothetical protein RSAG8_09760, partial [Rhizoctonia solani AG-8 WAC10335]
MAILPTLPTVAPADIVPLPLAKSTTITSSSASPVSLPILTTIRVLFQSHKAIMRHYAHSLGRLYSPIDRTSDF